MNPGSPTAQELGCVCPHEENNKGIAAPYPPGGWWVSRECPIHKSTYVMAWDVR